MRKYLLILVTCSLICLDQILKLFIVKNFQLGETKSVLNGVFSFTYLRNYGAAFSILQNQIILFTVITIVIVGSASYYLMKQKSTNFLLDMSLILIISGGLGNFIDRIRIGYVIDMIDLDFMNFAIFNLADSFLTIGVILLFIMFWKEEKYGNSN